MRSSVFLFKTPDGIQAGDVMQHVYEQHKFAIANLKVKGQDLLRISPTFCNTAQDVADVVAAVVDVIKGHEEQQAGEQTPICGPTPDRTSFLRLPSPGTGGILSPVPGDLSPLPPITVAMPGNRH